jgi:octaprenyl-diphosphate synthase
MVRGIQDCGRAPEELHVAYAPVREELASVEQLLRQVLQSQYPFLDRLMQHGFQLGGKRMRPALVLLSGKAAGTLTAEHPMVAAAVELIHTATLIHDDVLDEATIRRHLATINARWDNEASVLLGDYLLAQALMMASSLETTYACRALAEACRVMCEGELRQVENRGQHELTEEDYLDIISDKTAALCECCCRLGAHYAGAAPAQREALARFGHDLGIAFQITDDVLDVQGDEAKTGKSLGTDLLKQKATLPLIRLLDQADQSDRRQILEILTHPDPSHRRALRPWLQRYDAVDYARQKALVYVRIAQDQLEELPPSSARDSLGRLAEFVVGRQQ